MDRYMQVVRTVWCSAGVTGLGNGTFGGCRPTGSLQSCATSAKQ